MSVEEIKRFNEAVVADEGLKDEIVALGSDVDKLVALAKSKGYDFSADDLKAASAGDGELSEQELDSVAGGTTVDTNVLVYTNVVAALF